MQKHWRWTACLCAAMLAGCVQETHKKPLVSEVTVRTAPRHETPAPAEQSTKSTAPAAASSAQSAKAGGDQNVFSIVDACAEQLHEISGLLLEYFAIHRRLPDKLEDLLPLAEGGHTPALVCPVSKEAYVYDPNGPALPGAGRVIVYDAKPVHGGFRWGIAVAPPHDKQPLECKVIKVPEAALKRD